MSPVKLESPHPFAERFLFFGGGGVGKTETCLNIIDNALHGTMHVIDTDYSAAYDRAIATTYASCEDRVVVYPADQEWLPFIEAVEKAVGEGDPAHDWLTIDPCGASWDWVQEYTLTQVHGASMVELMIDLKRAHGNDASALAKAKSDLMNWDLVKREYSRLWKGIARWKGHLILTAEAKEIGKMEKDEEVKMMYGPRGLKPSGQATMRHVASTTLLLDHPRRGQWRVTTIKDRNRDELDKEVIESFAMDYLVEVAGWEMVKVKGES